MIFKQPLNFCLAKRDPNGCPSTGINRVDGSSVPNYIENGVGGWPNCNGANEMEIKNLSRWPLIEYYNIWIVYKSWCASPGGGAAWAGFPTGGDYDGVTMPYGYITGQTILSHEVGHGFSLYHTFQEDNGNAICPVDTNCLIDGDKVCDTPAHKASDCGNTNPCTNEGIWDNSRYNYMSYCGDVSYYRFTAGQKERVEATMQVYPRINYLSSLGCSPSNFNTTIVKTDVTCNITCNGSIAVYPQCSSNYTYSWSNGETTQTISNLCSGSYYVNITDANNNTTLIEDIVITELVPISPSITTNGLTAMCEGDSIELTANTANSYLWSNGATTQSIFVLEADSYYVAVIDSNGCSGVSSPVTISVNPLPSTPSITTSGTTTICQGNSLTLTSSIENSYLWSNGETTQSITVLNADNYSVIVTDGNGCSASSTETVVSVNSLPIALITQNGAITFCQGDSVILMASSANSYLWNDGSTTQSITVLNSGNYSVTVTDGNGCSDLSSSLAVTVNSLPSIPIVTANDTVLTSSYVNGNQWYFNGNIISGATSQNYSVTENGNYTVTVTNINGCSATSSPYNFTSLSVEDLVENSIAIIPNPNNGIFRIETKNLKMVIIKIYNALGEVIYESMNGNSKIDLSSEAKGNYFIEIYSEEKIYNKQLIIQ